MLLSICSIFWQFQPGVAYKSWIQKKHVFFKKPRSYLCFDYFLKLIFTKVNKGVLIISSFLLHNTLAIFQMAH